MNETHVKLRATARGSYGAEAAAELLIRAHGGQLARDWAPWLISDGDRAWFDFDDLQNKVGVLSGGERRLLEIAASLAGQHRIDLSDVAGLDRESLALTLAAIAHAGGSHEHSAVHHDEHGRLSFSTPGSLHPWPGPDSGVAATPPVTGSSSPTLGGPAGLLLNPTGPQPDAPVGPTL